MCMEMERTTEDGRAVYLLSRYSVCRDVDKGGLGPLWRGTSRVRDEVKQGLCWNLGKAKRWIFSLIGGFRMVILSLIMFGQGRWPWLVFHPSYP